jgi:hypothetical protein
LYVGSDSYRWYVPENATNVPGGSYLSRVSAEQSWIDSIIRPALTATATPSSLSATMLSSSAVPEPGAAVTLAALVAGCCLVRRRRR